MNKIANKPLSSADFMALLFSGIKKNNENKDHWSCDFCDSSIPHFHASSVGYCQRKLQYFIMYGMKHNKTFAESELAFLRDGHLNENIVREGLKGAGAILFYDAKKPTPHKKVKDVIIVIHKDILFKWNELLYLVEQKSLKDTNYVKVIKREENIPYWYLDQLQIYIDYYTGLLKESVYAFLLIKKRSSSEMYSFPIKLDKKRVKELYAKCQNILDHVKRNKIIDRPYKYEASFNKRPQECKLCQFHEQCYGDMKI